MVLAHPAGDERNEREPEKQMQICPKIATADTPYGVEHVVMIVPINPEKNKTQDIAEKNWPKLEQRG